MRAVCIIGGSLMRDITLALIELRDVLAVARNEISILEQTTRELRSIVALCDGAGANPLVPQSLDEIDARMAATLVRQTSIASILEELGRELRGRASGGSESAITGSGLSSSFDARPFIGGKRRSHGSAGA
jgi:hypothetical protein